MILRVWMMGHDTHNALQKLFHIATAETAEQAERQCCELFVNTHGKPPEVIEPANLIYREPVRNLPKQKRRRK